MKFLDRAAVSVPSCLARYRHGLNNWSELSTNNLENQEIWDSLLPLQNSHCAYCECSLEKSKHIEHFFPRNTVGYQSLTFTWSNLFGSCCQNERCGKFKDTHFKDDLKKIIKPDEDDPHEYFTFLTSGTIKIIENLSPQNKEKAELTLKAFNLNGDTKLTNSRYSSIQAYKDQAIAIYSLLSDENNEDIVKELIDEKILEVKALEFSSALIHLFQYNKYY